MHDEISIAIKEYLQARSRLIAVSAKYSSELQGNDNLIGRIGEYLALQFLRRDGRSPVKTKSLSQKGFDLEDGSLQISVKILTSENTRGRGCRLQEPWDEFILIYLDTSDLSGKIGFITKTQFLEASQERSRSENPIVSKSMLGQKGLFGKYGTVENVDQFL